MTRKGIKLKVACVREGFSQREIVRAVGVDPALISKVMAGGRHLNPKRKKIITRLLDRPIEVIFD